MSVIYLKDLTSALVPFDQVEMGILAGFITFTTLTTLLDIVLIYAIVKQRDIPIDSQFILHICVADVIFSVVVLAFHFINLASSGWSTGRLGCEINTVAVLLTIALSVLTLLFMTIHRYLIFIWGYHLTQNQVYQMIGGLWISLAVAASVYLTSGNLDQGIALQSSKYYCMIEFTSNEPSSLIIVYIMLSVLAFNMIFITYAYSAIVLKYMKLKRRAIQGRTNSQAQLRQEQEKSPQEKLLMTKAIAIAGAYAICWLPYIMKILYELITKQSVSFAYDCLCDLAGCANPLLNALVLLKYDAKIKNNVYEFFNELFNRATESQKMIKVKSAVNLGNLDKKNAGAANVLLRSSSRSH